MKKMYDWFMESGQESRAKEISDIPRYNKFAKTNSGEEEETKPKKVK